MGLEFNEEIADTIYIGRDRVKTMKQEIPPALICWVAAAVDYQ